MRVIKASALLFGLVAATIALAQDASSDEPADSRDQVPTSASPILEGTPRSYGVDTVVEASTSPFCILDAARYCVFRPEGPLNAPCRCGTERGRFGLKFADR